MVSSFGRGFDSRQLHIMLLSAARVMNKSNVFFRGFPASCEAGKFFCPFPNKLPIST